MRSLALDRHRKARVWLGELPAATFAADNVTAFIVPTASSERSVQRIAAVELMTPLGGRIMYALLGGQFTPDRSNALEISICAGSGSPFKESLVESLDDVHVGLPPAFVDGVMQGVRIALDATTVLAGKVVINCAAHAAAGSSVVAFRGVARSLMCLLNSPSMAPDDADLISIF